MCSKASFDLWSAFEGNILKKGIADFMLKVYYGFKTDQETDCFLPHDFYLITCKIIDNWNLRYRATTSISFQNQ